MSARRAAIRTACRAAGLPYYAADLQTVRGRCRHGRCKSRYAVVRVTLTFIGERVDRHAATECVKCGRTWRRCKVPALRSAAGYQAVRLTLILPSAQFKRWRSRGRWKREGDDSTVLRDADLGDLDEAATAHTARADRLADARARRKARQEAEAAALIASYREREAAYAARRAEREADEAAAAAREAAM